MTNVATHDTPAKLQCADHLVRIDLEDHGMPGRFEQLWARKLDGRNFEICCVPFFAYDIALGDIVETDNEFTVRRVVDKSGHKVIRVAVVNEGAAQKLHPILHEWVESTRLLYEWHGAGYLAIDVPEERAQSIDIRLLSDLAKRGEVYFETLE